MSAHEKTYPFSAIVGQERMKTALLVAAADPGIGGVLIRGHKGTAKTTAVRALSSVLPDMECVESCPYNCSPEDRDRMHDECRSRAERGEKLPSVRKQVSLTELPLNATEDRLAGTIHLERALAGGERVFEPGILARANRGILYIDEVNLLEDHLVDMLLDAAATGVNTVEREGISVRHPASFILIGTMNPEEGELRPQFQDRFALCVNITGNENPQARREIIRRRLEFERDPAGFIRSQAEAERLLKEQILTARNLLPSVTVPEILWDLTVKITISAGVQGHRADIAILRTARALAALLERTVVDADIIREAALLSLVHRIASDLHGSHEETEREVRRIVMNAGTSRKKEQDTFQDDNDDEDQDFAEPEPVQVPGAAAAGTMLFDFLKKKLPDRYRNELEER